MAITIQFKAQENQEKRLFNGLLREIDRRKKAFEVLYPHFESLAEIESCKTQLFSAMQTIRALGASKFLECGKALAKVSSLLREKAEKLSLRNEHQIDTALLSLGLGNGKQNILIIDPAKIRKETYG